MSPIIGTYTNASLNAKLVITKADDANGSISGTFSVGAASWPILGTWNTSTITPNAVFYFTGSGLKPTVVVSGSGASPNFQTFANTTINVSMAATGGVVNNLSGPFVRS